MKCIVLLLITPLFLIPADREMELTGIGKYHTQAELSQLHQTLSTEKSLDEMINYLNVVIDKQYPPTLTSSFTRKESDYVGIINTVYTCYPTINPNNDFIKKLEAKNENFKNALLYFSYFAERNSDAVTCDTLKKVEDPLQEQPVAQLNMLPVAIRIYLMKKIQENSGCSYDIPIEAKNGNCKQCDICPERHLLVSSHEDQKILLWDLAKNTYCGEIITNSAEVTAIAFHPFKSQIAIGQCEKDSIPSIKIVDFQTKKTIFERDASNDKTDIRVHYLKFSKINDTSFLLSAFMKKDCSDYVTIIHHQWYISEDQPTYVDSIYARSEHDLNQIIRGCYYAWSPDFKPFFKSTLTITKNKCYHLYLCKQAVKAITTQEDVKKIISSKSYELLTEYEKKMIDKHIQQKLEKDKNPSSNFMEIFQWQAK